MANNIPQSTTAESLYKFIESKHPDQLNGKYAIVGPINGMYYWYPREVVERNGGSIDEELNENLARKHGDKHVVLGDEPVNTAMDLASIASAAGGLIPPVGIAAPAVTNIALSGIDQARDKERQEDWLVPAIQTGILAAGAAADNKLKKPTVLENDGTAEADAIAEEKAAAEIEKAKAEREKKLADLYTQRQAEMIPDPAKAAALRVDSLAKLINRREHENLNPNVGDDLDMELAKRVDETRGSLTRAGYARDDLNKFNAKHPGLSGYDWEWNDGRNMDELRQAAKFVKTLDNKKAPKAAVRGQREAFADLINARLQPPLYLNPNTEFGQRMLDDLARSIYNTKGNAKYNDLGRLFMHEPTKYGTIQGYASRGSGSTDADASYRKHQAKWGRDYAMEHGGLMDKQADAEMKAGYKTATERGKKYPSYEGPTNQSKNKFTTNKEWEDINKWANEQATPTVVVNDNEVPAVDEQAIRNKYQQLERAKVKPDNLTRASKFGRSKARALAKLLTIGATAVTPIVTPIIKRDKDN